MTNGAEKESPIIMVQKKNIADRSEAVPIHKVFEEKFNKLNEKIENLNNKTNALVSSGAKGSENPQYKQNIATIKTENKSAGQSLESLNSIIEKIREIDERIKKTTDPDKRKQLEMERTGLVNEAENLIKRIETNIHAIENSLSNIKDLMQNYALEAAMSQFYEWLVQFRRQTEDSIERYEEAKTTEEKKEESGRFVNALENEIKKADPKDEVILEALKHCEDINANVSEAYEKLVDLVKSNNNVNELAVKAARSAFNIKAHKTEAK